jgi:hypothetical protein
MFTPSIPGEAFEQPIIPDPSDMPTVDDLVRAVIAAEEAEDAKYCRPHGVRADEHVGGCA